MVTVHPERDENGVWWYVGAGDFVGDQAYRERAVPEDATIFEAEWQRNLAAELEADFQARNVDMGVDTEGEASA